MTVMTIGAKREDVTVDQMQAAVAANGWDRLWGQVAGELAFQTAKWGDQSGYGPEMWWLIVSEEFGEAARDLNDGRWPNAQAEIVQIIACLARLHAKIGAIEAYENACLEDAGGAG